MLYVSTCELRTYAVHIITRTDVVMCVAHHVYVDQMVGRGHHASAHQRGDRNGKQNRYFHL